MGGAAARRTEAARLPEKFEAWFESRGWRARDHQLDVFARAEAGGTTLLIAPTGGGKTLAGFLPSLVDLDRGVPGRGIHTLYISPLKALAVDIARNLEAPVSEMGLKIRLETRTGNDTADWPVHFCKHRAALLLEIEQMAQNPRMARLFDTDRLHRDLSQWDGGNALASYSEHKIPAGVGRAIRAARFIKYVEGSNEA